jgi:choice-of-anchor B domain-containing protein
MRPTRILSLAVAVALLPAASAAAHPPGQHADQELSASQAFGTFSPMEPLRTSAGASCENGMAGPYPCRDVDLAGHVPLPMLGGATGNDLWGWTDPETKREYAIVGTSTSTGFVDVTKPDAPVLVGVLPTRGTPDFVLWRDVKVHDDHAFIVSEISRAGLQVFDLKRLRGRTTPTVFTADATYDGFSNAHNISINNESETAYVVGTNTCSGGGEKGGLHMLDISTPTKPAFLGCAVVTNETGGANNNYAHDVECEIYDGPDRQYRGREICFGSNENVVAIYDVTDKANPRVLSTTTYPGAAYTHQGSLTDDQRWFIFGDELDEQAQGSGTKTYIMDARDLDAPAKPLVHEAASKSIDHNLYIHGDKVFASNYTSGLRILEFDRKSLEAGQLREVAFFDVVPGVDVAEFAGTWSNYRFPGSGTTIVSAIENEASGLFILQPRLDEKGKGRR